MFPGRNESPAVQKQTTGIVKEGRTMASNAKGGLPEGSEMLLMAIIMGVGMMALAIILYFVAK